MRGVIIEYKYLLIGLLIFLKKAGLCNDNPNFYFQLIRKNIKSHIEQYKKNTMEIITVLSQEMFVNLLS